MLSSATVGLRQIKIIMLNCTKSFRKRGVSFHSIWLRKAPREGKSWFPSPDEENLLVLSTPCEYRGGW